MRVGAEASYRWFALCERLGARGGFTYHCPLPPLTLRPKPPTPLSLDVVMADTPLVSTPLAGTKRTRDDEGESEEQAVWDLEMRAEKVSVLPRLT